jgi:hypothetical protein
MRSATLVALVLAMLVAATVLAPPALAQEMGLVNGTVTDVHDNPLQGVQIRAVGVLDKEQNVTVTAGEDGAFSFSVPPGDYDITITNGDRTLKTLRMTVQEGNNMPILMVSMEEKFTLTGVVLSGGGPLVDVTVRLESVEGDARTATTDADGLYRINNIPEGNYTVTFSKSGYRTMEKAISLPDDSTLDIEMERMGLPARDGFLAGYDLGHSLMVVALGLAVATLIVALFARYQVRKKPELLSRDDSEA